eukprot:6189133-Pleurochrysis_carterae.AAC.4
MAPRPSHSLIFEVVVGCVCVVRVRVRAALHRPHLRPRRVVHAGEARWRGCPRRRADGARAL